ncbi:MAG: response regulator [Chloroflexi bacterium]|nr:response regulator [Chloroflexota bacterium]
MSSQPDSTNQTVLIVDDNLTNMRVLSSMLEKLGYTVLVARDGIKAVETAQHTMPDVILLDVMMPGIDGFETCRRLKKIPSTRDIPIIFLTALTSTEHKVEGFRVGAVDYITKPLQHEEVAARVKTHVQLQILSRSMQQQNTYLTKMMIQRKMINNLILKLSAILDINKLYSAIADLIQNQFNYALVNVWQLSSQKDRLILQACSGKKDSKLLKTGIHLTMYTGPTLVWETYQKEQTSQVNDWQAESYYQPLTELSDSKSEIAIPLCFEKRILGVLDIHSNQADDFDTLDRTTLQTLTDQIAVALRNAKMYQDKGLKTK